MMRLLVAAMALAAASASPGAARETPVSALAPGEVLLEIEAAGTSLDPAHEARLTVSLTGRGATAADARNDLEAQVARATAAARRAGVAANDVRAYRLSEALGFVGNDAALEHLGSPGPEADDAGQRYAARMLTVLVRRPATAEQVKTALEDIGDVSSPVYGAADRDMAKRAARADAFRRARADADALAAAANMRVVRVVRISERVDADTLSAEMLRRMSGDPPLRESATDVETRVQLSVDFALAPR